MRVRYIIVAALVLAGCAKMGAEMWVSKNPEKVRRDSSECERDASAAGSAWMDLWPLMRRVTARNSTQEIYESCMELRGYQRKTD